MECNKCVNLKVFVKQLIFIVYLVCCVLLQGVRPEAFDKVENTDIKEIIDGCTRTKKEDRYD